MNGITIDVPVAASVNKYLEKNYMQNGIYSLSLMDNIGLFLLNVLHPVRVNGKMREEGANRIPKTKYEEKFTVSLNYFQERIYTKGAVITDRNVFMFNRFVKNLMRQELIHEINTLMAVRENRVMKEADQFSRKYRFEDIRLSPHRMKVARAQYNRDLKRLVNVQKINVRLVILEFVRKYDLEETDMNFETLQKAWVRYKKNNFEKCSTNLSIKKRETKNEEYD